VTGGEGGLHLGKDGTLDVKTGTGGREENCTSASTRKKGEKGDTSFFLTRGGEVRFEISPGDEKREKKEEKSSIIISFRKKGGEKKEKGKGRRSDQILSLNRLREKKKYPNNES